MSSTRPFATTASAPTELTGTMPDAPFTILFVCTGNTCRSPLAEVIARRESETRGLEGRVEIRSAGTSALPGYAASEGSLVVASRHGLDLSDHRSSVLTAESAGAASLVLGLTRSHVHAATSVAPEARVSLLGDFAEGVEGTGPSVPDPVGMPLEVYEETYDVLDQLVTKAMDRVVAEVGDA